MNSLLCCYDASQMTTSMSRLQFIFYCVGYSYSLLVSPSNALDGVRFSSDFCYCDASLLTKKFVKVAIQLIASHKLYLYRSVCFEVITSYQRGIPEKRPLITNQGYF